MTADDVTRRSALTAAGVVAAGGVAGYVAGRNTAAAKGNEPITVNPYGKAPTARQSLAKVDDIPDGGGLIIDHPAVVLTRSGSDVHAFSAVCTHQGCLVNKVADGSIDCPCHGSRFDATSGKVLAGPAAAPLSTVRVTVRGGEVFSG